MEDALKDNEDYVFGKLLKWPQDCCMGCLILFYAEYEQIVKSKL